MTLDLYQLAQRLVPRILTGLGGFSRSFFYVRPMGLNAGSGVTFAVETRLTAVGVVAHYQPRELGLIEVRPGDRKVLLPASALGALEPLPGDFLLDEALGERFNVVAAELDALRVLWRLQVVPTWDDDYGTLADATLTEDWGDLAAASVQDDRLFLK